MLKVNRGKRELEEVKEVEGRERWRRVRGRGRQKGMSERRLPTDREITMKVNVKGK